MEFLFKTIYFYLIAFFLAILEIQIEGEHGWAEKLPTWRPGPGSKIEKVYKKLMSQKELTGYHTALNIFLFLFLHWPFIWNWQWSIWQELEILSIFVLFVVVWDFLWFVLNPKLSLRDFGPRRIWWHKSWTGRVPTDYWFGILGSLLLLLPESIVFDWCSGVSKMIVLLGVNFVLTLLTVIIYPRAY